MLTSARKMFGVSWQNGSSPARPRTNGRSDAKEFGVCTDREKHAAKVAEYLVAGCPEETVAVFICYLRTKLWSVRPLSALYTNERIGFAHAF
jgi:hypothetical protein